MTKLIKVLMVLSCVLAQSEAFAQYESTSSTTYYNSESSLRFNTFTRVSPLVGVGDFGLTSSEGKSKAGRSITGGLILSLGRGMLTWESGALYFAGGGDVTYDTIAKDDATGVDKIGNPMPVNHRLMYIGVPLIAKYSYFERPQATFFTKAGIMPAFLVSATNEWTDIDSATNKPVLVGDTSKEGLSEMDVLGVIGIGGTTPLSDNCLFLLDISFFRGFLPIVPESSSYNQGLALSVGLTIGI